MHAWAERTPDAVAAVFRTEDGAPRRVDVRRALRAGREARGGARRARRRRRRPRRDLHADGAGSRRRLARLRPHRGDPGADLLRLRRARRRAAATGLRREGRDHRRLLAAPRRPRADAGDDRGGAARVADRRARRRVVAGRSKLGRRARSRRAGAARGRGGASVSARVHVRDDGAPEGRTARARRLPALDRPRGRLPGRHSRRRPRPLRNRHGLDHGAVDGGRRRRRRRRRRLHGGRARPSRRPALAADRGRAGDDARRLAHADPGADPEGRAPAGPVVAALDHDDRASRGTRGRTTGSTSTSPAAAGSRS